MKLFSTSCETLFLGWDAPLLSIAVETLCARYAVDGSLNLGSLDCVLPTAHSVRRLGARLQGEAESRGLMLTPPRIMTIGQLAERLYRPPAPLALEFEQTLAWARALRALEPEQLAPLIPVIPAREPVGPWLELAGTVRGLHEELSSSRLTFAEVADVAETDAERRRWTLLRRLQLAYLRELDDAGLCDPSVSRREAVLHNRCHSDQTVVLIGTSDLSDAMVEMLRALNSPLIALVAAPPSESSRFDEFGCVDTASWLRHKLPLKDRDLVVAGDMLDQSSAVAEVVAEFASTHSADQVTVGVTDESQVGPIEVELRGCGVSTYRHLGWTLSRTAIGRLLELATSHLQRQTWQSLAALVRHADVHALVSQHFADNQGNWLIELDQLLAEHFPLRIADPLPPRSVKRLPRAKELGDLITRWLSCFDGPEQTISQWSEVAGRWLATLYGEGWQNEGLQNDGAGDGFLDRERTGLALRAAGRVLNRFAELNKRLDVSVGGAAALEMLSARLADVRVLEPTGANRVEILGWLDLALEDSPALVVDGLNHPFVPRAVTSDPFLPGTLRAKLPIADNDRRFARDVYAMQLMLSTRSSIRFIVGKSAADQSPTPPSRLLAAAEPRDIARRVRMLLSSQRDAVPVEHRWDQGPERHRLVIPSLDVETGAVPSLSVTAFRDYLVCPYRFYLRHVLKLKPLDDSASELAANQFGDLIHGALELFGRSTHKHESDPTRIEKRLRESLHQYASDQYSEYSSTAVQIQVSQAERRLRAVAVAQASRIAEGWQIDRVEASVGPEQNAIIEVDGESIAIKGRFDRIDVRSRGGQRFWSILDYKTHGHSPEKKHLKRTEQGVQWIDLQLPLYRMMVPFLGIDADPSDVALGYFNIGEKEVETRVNEADFGEELMVQAEELIRDCVRRIRARDFRPSQQRVDYDDYGMILQTGVAGRMLDQLERSLGDEAES